ncbi:STAS domain-containing protein [Rossellomorea aquimaris]|uniref:STAS domain-containing protein n=1 Tax=Rossellomorea aquimaris TaxID=189382 RepID=UPI0007D0AFC6|nr:STAS domain-containing protein [Rossellomorea aquimaris]
MTLIKEFTDIGEQVTVRKKDIAERIYTELSIAYPSDYTEDSKGLRIPFFEQLVDLIGKGLLKEEAWEENTYRWGLEVGYLATSNGTPLNTTLQKTTLYKKVIIEDILKHVQKNLVQDLLLELTFDIDLAINNMVTGFCQAYKDYDQQQLKESEEKFLSLSTPVVPIFAELAVLPLVGQVDETRAEVMAEHVLIECKRLSINKLIVDLSGVYEINPLFQQGIMKLLDSLKLLGIKPILSGMRPEMSIEFVQLGINLSGIHIYQSLSKAVENHQ